jgi:hypothetical protein
MGVGSAELQLARQDEGSVKEALAKAQRYVD